LRGRIWRPASRLVEADLRQGGRPRSGGGSSRPLRTRWRALLAVAVLLTASPQVSAQDPTATLPAPSPALTRATVPITAIPARLEETAVRLHEIEADLVPDPAIDVIASDLPQRNRAIQEVLQRTRESFAAGPDVLQLRFLAARLRSAGQRLTPWQGLLAARLKQVEGLLEELGRERSLWRATEGSLAPADLPAALRQRLAETIAAVEQAEARAQIDRERVLVLSDEVGRRDAELQEQIADIERGYTGARRRMFALDAPPLWRVLPGSGDSLGSEGAAVWAEVKARISTYVQDEGEAPFRQLVLFFVLLAITVTVARRWRARAPTELGPNARELLDRPVSVALLLAVLVTPWMQANAPPLVRELIGLVAILALGQVLSSDRDADVRRAVFAAVPIWFPERIAVFLPVDSPLSRLLLLVSSALGCGILLWLTSEPVVARLELTSRWRRLFLTVGRIGAFGFGLAVVANVVGAVSLARGVTSWVLSNAVIAVILYVAARLLRVVVETVLALPPLGRLTLVQRRRIWLGDRIGKLIAALFGLFWGWEALARAGADVAIRDWVRDVLTYPLEVGSLAITPGNVLAFALVLWAASLLSRFLSAALEEEVLPRMALPRGVPQAVSAGSRYVFLTLGVLLAISAAGVELGHLGLIVGALGVGVGFGLQNVVNNFVSGVILLFERPIQIGDTIEVGSLIGEVRRIGIRSSTVRTWEGAEVIVPNEKLVSAELVNWTLSDRHRRIEIEVGVSYGSDPARVVALLESAALASPATLREPRPLATLVNFGDSALVFRLRFWTSDLAEQFRSRGEVTLEVHRIFAESGIEIPFPQRVFHITADSPPGPDAPGPSTPKPPQPPGSRQS
jgi:potassium-dependent mechanosensitive channel